MLQIHNKCPFAPAISVFPNERGIETLSVIVKGSFAIRRTLAVAAEQAAPFQMDHYWGEPVRSSLKYASEMQLAKPTTDVAVVGQAWAPGGRPTGELDVRFAIAEKEHQLRVFGRRHWKQGAITPPEPFERMPVVYEYAFGGRQAPGEDGREVTAEERNPLGKGFRGRRSDEDMEGAQLPNIEDPRCLMSEVGDEAAPAGFGFIASAWLPRRRYAGTYDEAWQKNRSPYLPDDFDPRFLNAAHPDLVFDRYLQGGEPVELDNMSGRGPLRFRLPTCKLKIGVRIAGTTQTPPANLETVLIEPESDRLGMTWHASLPCDKKTLKIERVQIDMLSLDLHGGAS